MPTIYIIRAVGSTLILTSSSAPAPPLPTVFVVATFRNSETVATFRSGEALAEAR